MNRKYNHVRHENGEITSTVGNWEVTYPSTCNGRLSGLGFVASLGYGGSDFVHFDGYNQPYGTLLLTKKTAARLATMAKDYESETK